MTMKFDYYYGNEADQFTFIRIPKVLLTHEAFADLSIQAKVLFGILLDRMSLSMRNEWLDEENRVYIIYQIQEIQNDLGFSKKKAMDYLGELEKIGLVEKKRRGLGLPSILYVKSFLSGVEDENSEEECLDISDQDNSAENGTSRSVDLGTSETDNKCQGGQTSEQKQHSRAEEYDKKCTIQPISTENRTASGVNSKVEKARSGKINKIHARGVDLGTSRSIDLGTSRSVDLGTSRSVDLGTSRGAEIALQEVPARGPLKNNINIINTYMSDTESNLISSGEDDSKLKECVFADQDQMGSDEMPLTISCSDHQNEKSKIKNTLAAYRSLILENISYDCLKERYPYDGDLLDGIVDIMLEVVMNQGEYMQIASATYPTELVKSRFLKLDSQHIQYVISCFNKNTTKVGNIKKYLMTALFNAPSTIGGYYTAEVHHDMPYLARG